MFIHFIRFTFKDSNFILQNNVNILFILLSQFLLRISNKIQFYCITIKIRIFDPTFNQPPLRLRKLLTHKNLNFISRQIKMHNFSFFMRLTRKDGLIHSPCINILHIVSHIFYYQKRRHALRLFH